jgi:hypothetical protein
MPRARDRAYRRRPGQPHEVFLRYGPSSQERCRLQGSAQGGSPAGPERPRTAMNARGDCRALRNPSIPPPKDAGRPALISGAASTLSRRSVLWQSDVQLRSRRSLGARQRPVAGPSRNTKTGCGKATRHVPRSQRLPFDEDRLDRRQVADRYGAVPRRVSIAPALELRSP